MSNKKHQKFRVTSDIGYWNHFQKRQREFERGESCYSTLESHIKNLESWRDLYREKLNRATDNESIVEYVGVVASYDLRIKFYTALKVNANQHTKGVKKS